MRGLLGRYVGSHVISGIMLIAAIVVGLDVFIAILSELDDAQGAYTQLEATLHVLLTVPRRLNDYLPYCIMIGALFGLGSLANSSELTVIRAAGVSVLQIIVAALKPVFVFILMGLVLVEYVAPFSEQLAESRKGVLRYGQNIVTPGGGVWSRDGQHYMHFSAVEPGGVLYGVSVYEFDAEQQLNSIVRADRAIYQDNQIWQMEQVQETIWGAETTDIVRENTRIWQTSITPDLLNVLVLKPKRMSISNLWEYARFTEVQGLANQRFLLSFWSKVLQPLTTLALVIVAMSFVFGPLREITMGFRLFCGVAVGLGFRMVQNILGPASLIFEFSPAFSVIIPSVACVLFAWYMLRKV